MAPGRGITTLRNCLSHYSDSLHKSHSASPWSLPSASNALEVIPERISVPEVAGTIDPADVLKGGRLKQFLEHRERVGGPPPPPRVTYILNVVTV